MAEFGTPTIKRRDYYSSYHLWAAKHFVILTNDIEKAHTGRSKFDIEHRSFVTSAIFSSVAFMEAAINEFFQDAFDEHKSYIAALDKEIMAAIGDWWKENGEHNIKAGSRISVLDKYQRALIIAQKEPFLRGQSPYQDAKLVIVLRNALVHYKLKTQGGGDTHYLEDKLQSKKFALNKMMIGGGDPFFPHKCLGHGCAEWSVTSSLKLVDAFFDKLGITPNYQKADFSKN